MEIFDISQCKNESGGFMAIGFFDSLHIGHKEVIRKAVSLAKEQGTISSVFLFKNNIFEMIGQNKIPLFSFEERLREIESLAVDKLFYIEADDSFLALSPQGFANYLKERLRIRGMVCGKDFTYGKKGEGRAVDLLIDFPESVILDLCLVDGEKVSTTLLKEKLSKGEAEASRSILGRPFSFSAKVLHGRHQGKKIGFPTINMPISNTVLKAGVYFTEAVINGVPYPSLTNVGAHPTFGDHTENAETYILDFQGDLYDETIEIRFLHYHREIVSYEKAEDLIVQIKEDEKERRKYD